MFLHRSLEQYKNRKLRKLERSTYVPNPDHRNADEVVVEIIDSVISKLDRVIAERQ